MGTHRKMPTFESLEQIKYVFSHSFDCLIVIDDAGLISFLNESAKKTFRITTQDLIGKSLYEIIPNYQQKDQLEFEKIPLCGLCGEGVLFPIKILSYSLNIDNKSYEVLNIIDLDLEEYNNNLNKQLCDIKMALDESAIVNIMDMNGNIQFVNKKFCEISKYDKEELIGKSHQILSSTHHSNEFFQEMWIEISSGKVWRGEVQNKAKDGTFYWVHSTIVPFLDDQGKPFQYIEIQTDITEQKETEAALQKSLKDDFIHTIKNLENGIFKMKKNENGKLIYTLAEGKLLEQLGINTNKVNDKTPIDVFQTDIGSFKEKIYEKAFKGSRVNYEIELCGKLLYVDVSPLKQGDAVVELVGSLHDVTELRATQRQLHVNQQIYQSLFEQSNDAVITFDTQGRITNLNSVAENLLGYKLENVQNKQALDKLAKEYLEIRNVCFQNALQGKPQNFDTLAYHNNGKLVHLNITYIPIIEGQAITGVFAIGKDITKQKSLQELNAFLAHHDELTKLPNRRGFEERLREALNNAELNQQKLALMYLDLDRFKHLNDTLGHVVGDRLLEQIAARFRKSQKGSSSISRMGGDEFMIICPEIERYENPDMIAKELLNTLKAPFFIEEYELYITASIGISIYPTDGNNIVDLMKRADVALYRAKDQGRNTFQMYSMLKDVRNEQSFFMERDLRKALTQDQLIVHFQPRVDGNSGKIVSAEALLRWNHPEFGLVPPSNFIPLAEESGLIIPIGQWVKEKVCEQLLLWKRSGLPIVPISVNISPRRFLQKDFTQNIKELLEKYELDGNLLEIEITEDSLMKIETHVFQTINELKELGIKILIDDFGTGYSSFSYLKSFKLNGIKIDRSFIQDVSSESENAGITKAMIKMAQTLKMEVIAEGVETIEELMFLRDQGCHQVQGFLFSKPCSSEDFEKLLQKGKITLD